MNIVEIATIISRKAAWALPYTHDSHLFYVLGLYDGILQCEGQNRDYYEEIVANFRHPECKHHQSDAELQEAFGRVLRNMVADD